MSSAQLPGPYDHITGSPVLSPKWGPGWLGHTTTGSVIRFWFVDRALDGAVEVEHDEIYAHVDASHNEIWLILGRHDDPIPFLVDPPEGVESVPMPRIIRRFLG